MFKYLVCRMHNTSKLILSTIQNWKFKSNNPLYSNTYKEMTLFSRILLEKLIVLQIYNKFCDFFGNKVLIITVTGRTMWLTSEDTDALQACRLEFSGLAVAWRECDFSRQQKAYSGGGTVPPLPFPLSYLLILTVLIRFKKQLYELFSVFISLLYMFRATQCSASWESIASIHHLVWRSLTYITDGHPRRVIHTRWFFQITNLMHNSFTLQQYVC